MKNRNVLLTVAVFLGMISGLTAQNVPSYVPTNGLVGWWPFNGNANDESGNGNNGTVNGAALTSDRFGNANKAYILDGTNDYIEIGDPIINSLDFQGAPFTISAWFYANTIIGSQFPLLEKSIGYNINSGDYSLFMTNSSTDGNTIRFHISFGNGDGAALSAIPVNTSQWNQVAIVFNSTSDMKLYFNNNLGLNCFGCTANPISLSNSSTPMRFGWAQQSNSFFDGKLDDIGIWNRALSPQEITQLYNQGICKTSITVTDTLLIHTGITSYNPVAYQNTLKVWPNPGNQDITLDAGNLASMQGWKYKVANTLGQTVVNETAINQQQTTIDLTTWGGNGIYYIHIINPQGHAIEIKKIVLAP